jgi:hypothetical protein
VGDVNTTIIVIFDSLGNKYEYDVNIADIMKNPFKPLASHEEGSHN